MAGRSIRRTGSAVVLALVGLGVALTAPAAAAPPAERAAPPAPTGWHDSEWGDDETNEDEGASITGTWRADQDAGSNWAGAKAVVADNAWGRRDRYGRFLTGQGVTVALIDTGVSPVTGLNGYGKVTNGPDLSFESQTSNTRHLDGYGHGTHLAGIIAGRDPYVRSGRERDPQHFVGIAPDARILNMKVAAADGGTDVTQVIAAIDWVVQHRKDNGMNVRVINLAYGTNSTQSYLLDPLAHAVESAWRHGIVVVVAAGNDGVTQPLLTMPAVNPRVIAVGAADHRGSVSTGDDTVADFTNGGTSGRGPDLLAPGKSTVSLRVPGSRVDRAHPEGLVTGDTQKRFFRGSGTSQASAVVSGAVAMLLQQRPQLTPDQVKKLLTTTARPLSNDRSRVQGAGMLDIDRAIGVPSPSVLASAQSHLRSTGTGSLELARGSSHVVDPDNGSVLTGERDIHGAPWDARTWSSKSMQAAAWKGGDWNARTWSGSAWSGSSWSARTWSARTWSGTSWSARTWSARTWSSDVWSARTWSGNDWRARTWSSDAWRARTWSSLRDW